MRRSRLSRGSAGLLFGLAMSLAASAADRPNVVILVADDLGWADVGYHGGPIQTPNIDRLAREGLRLEHFYTAPHCTPTRTMLMTGRDPIRVGLAYEQINPWNNAGVPVTEHFMPESFRAAGYQTGMVGKWHLGHTAQPFHPNRRGFDDYYGHLNTAIDYWDHSRRKGRDWQRNGKTVEERGGYATDLQGQGAVRFIRERDPSRPFFLYVAFNAPHNPMQAPKELVEQYAHLPKRSDAPGYLAAMSEVPEAMKEHFASFRRTYAAMVDSMDGAVGQVLAALDEQELAEDTIVVFLSDNGGFNIFGGDNTPLRGQKASTFEGGIRVPAVIRWPAKLEGGKVRDQLVTAMDVFPTLASAAGVAVGSSLPLDGVDLWEPIVAGQSEPRPRDLFYVSEVPIPGQVWFAVRSGRWKLVQVERPGRLPTATHLFDIDADPHEKTDLAARHPERVDALVAKLAEWKKLHPHFGLRRSPGPHPGWLPPKDWATTMLGAAELQTTTESDFVAEAPPGTGPGILLYRTPEERGR